MSRRRVTALAVAHGRSGDAAMISGYIGEDEGFDQALVDFAETYADLSESHYALMIAAIGEGKIAVASEV